MRRALQHLVQIFRMDDGTNCLQPTSGGGLDLMKFNQRALALRLERSLPAQPLRSMYLVWVQEVKAKQLSVANARNHSLRAARHVCSGPLHTLPRDLTNFV
jgi:hypothetical protein